MAPLDDLASLAVDLEQREAELAAEALLRRAITRDFPGEIAVVSSFGAESAVLLHLVAAIDRATPILFLDTGKHFGETRRHRDELVERLGLSGLRIITPAAEALASEDPDGMLFSRDPNRCCYLRKVAPLRRALAPYRAWINGRKSYQADSRSDLQLYEAAGDKVKVNPLARWRREQVTAYLARHDLPRHPLVAQGFQSIGCMPCTDRIAPGEDGRAGRWRGSEKTECGIHTWDPGSRSL